MIPQILDIPLHRNQKRIRLLLLPSICPTKRPQANPAGTLQQALHLEGPNELQALIFRPRTRGKLVPRLDDIHKPRIAQKIRVLVWFQHPVTCNLGRLRNFPGKGRETASRRRGAVIALDVWEEGLELNEPAGLRVSVRHL